MTVFPTLLKKHAHEARWSLGIAASAFGGLGVLTVWLTLRAERVIAAGDFGPQVHGLGRFRFLGGPEMDFSTLAMEVCFWNHPFIVLTVFGWAIARGSLAIGGEIERGTLDLVLSRPVSRTSYLTSHIIFTLLGFMTMAAALIAGCLIGGRIYAVKSPPTVLALTRPAVMVVALGMSIYGYTLPFSAVDVVRWRSGVCALGLTLVGLIAMTIAPQFEGYDWLEKLTVFRAYTPVTVAMKPEHLSYNAAVLTGVCVAGCLIAYAGFLTRDLPANS